MLPRTLCCRGHWRSGSQRGYCGSMSPPLAQRGLCGWPSAPGRTRGTTPTWTPGSGRTKVLRRIKKCKTISLVDKTNVLVVCEAVNLLKRHMASQRLARTQSKTPFIVGGTKPQRLTPTFLSSSPTMFRAEILADMVSAVAEKLSPAGRNK